MFHCHNLRHEDHEMMRAFRLLPTAQGKTATTGYVGNTTFVQSGTLYDMYADPRYGPASAVPTSQAPSLATTSSANAYLQNVLAKRLYRCGGAAEWPERPSADSSM